MNLRVTPRITGARRRETPAKSGAVCWGAVDSWDEIESRGYRSLAACPEVVSAVDRISELAGLMPIQLMENKDNGNVRVNDRLAHKIDVGPYANGTRASWVAWIVQTLFLGGDGNAVVLPLTRGGQLEDLLPIPPELVSFAPGSAGGYTVFIDGQPFDPNDVLHFRLRPDPSYPWKGSGYRLSMSSVLSVLAQARATELGFMSSRWKPSIIIKVDANAEEFRSAKARDKFLADYIGNDAAGKPWLIPGDLMDVKEIRPLSLADLAVNDTVTLDKRTVGSLLGVPAFLLGVGPFSADEYNSFISSRLLTVMTGIQQEMTKKLLTNPARFFRFSPRQLYSYSLEQLASVGGNLYVRGIVSGNEVRDWLGMTPVKGLDERVILENYIPAGMIGQQKKLVQQQKEE